jgi:hypothetical protein
MGVRPYPDTAHPYTRLATAVFPCGSLLPATCAPTGDVQFPITALRSILRRATRPISFSHPDIHTPPRPSPHAIATQPADSDMCCRWWRGCWSNPWCQGRPGRWLSSQGPSRRRLASPFLLSWVAVATPVPPAKVASIRSLYSLPIYRSSPPDGPWPRRRTLSFNCFRRFRVLFQVFHLDVETIYLGCCICCNDKIRMLQAYVSSVSDVCCKCFIWMF